MTSASADKYWYRVYAKLGMKSPPHVNFERAAYPTYRPKVRVPGRRARRGVISLVRFAMRPLPVPDGLIEESRDPADWSHLQCCTRQCISSSL
jgi:hypothetical protein